jgi:hypothetical protein
MPKYVRNIVTTSLIVLLVAIAGMDIMVRRLIRHVEIHMVILSTTQA